MSEDKAPKKVKAAPEPVEPIARLKALEVLYMKKFGSLTKEGRDFLRKRIDFWSTEIKDGCDLAHLVQLEDDLFKKYELSEQEVSKEEIEFLKDRISFWEEHA